MVKSWWIGAYATMFVIVSAGIVLGVVQSCPQLQDLGPAFGCGDSVGIMSWSWHLIFWVVASGVVTLLGVVAVFASRRRPTAASFVVWGSAGLLELAATVSGEIQPRTLEIPLQLSMLLTMIVAIPAGASLSRIRQEEKVSVDVGRL